MSTERGDENIKGLRGNVGKDCILTGRGRVRVEECNNRRGRIEDGRGLC